MKKLVFILEAVNDNVMNGMPTDAQFFNALRPQTWPKLQFHKSVLVIEIEHFWPFAFGHL